MNARELEAAGVSPKQVLTGLADIEWRCDTDKAIQGQCHAIELFGFRNPLKFTPIGLNNGNRALWSYSQTAGSQCWSKLRCGRICCACRVMAASERDE